MIFTLVTLIICGLFSLNLFPPGSNNTVWLSTAPTQPLTHWYQVEEFSPWHLLEKLYQVQVFGKRYQLWRLRCGVFSPSPSSPSRGRWRFFPLTCKSPFICSVPPWNLCRCCQAGCWWWPMPSRAMTSPSSARLRWILESFPKPWDPSISSFPGHQHCVLKHPRPEKPILQVMLAIIHCMPYWHW